MSWRKIKHIPAAAAIVTADGLDGSLDVTISACDGTFFLKQDSDLIMVSAEYASALCSAICRAASHAKSKPKKKARAAR
jgi:hypothetical protein